MAENTEFLRRFQAIKSKSPEEWVDPEERKSKDLSTNSWVEPETKKPPQNKATNSWVEPKEKKTQSKTANSSVGDPETKKEQKKFTKFFGNSDSKKNAKTSSKPTEAPKTCEVCESKNCNDDHCYEELGAVCLKGAGGYANANAYVNLGNDEQKADLSERLRTIEATQTMIRQELANAQAAWMSEIKQLKAMNLESQTILTETTATIVKLSEQALAASDTLGGMITSVHKDLKSEINSQSPKKGKGILSR